MKSSELLIHQIVNDVHNLMGTNGDRDNLRISSRIEAEGLSFLEKTLPSLDDALLEGLSSGRLPVIQGWQRRKKTRIPVFLQDFWDQIFFPDGYLRPAPTPFAILAIRQVSRTYKKIFEVCSEDLVDKAITGFINTDLDVGLTASAAEVESVSEVCRALFSRALSPLSSGISTLDCKHGPGAVSDRSSSPEKWSFASISRDVADEFGYEFFLPNLSWLDEDGIEFHHDAARLTAVPKTASKPRLISIEPTDHQFVQQGIRNLIEPGLSRMRICSYKDQTPNQDLAREGSITGDLATLDLSEASDRVLNELVTSLFDWHPNFNRLSQACRSKVVQLPDGRRMPIRKFASMGSALTFPVETMVFTAILAYSICKSEGDLSSSAVRRFSKRRDIRVYGDDIICPSQYAPTVIETLTKFGLKVNESKSFWSGKFRESCGADWYNGFSVKPIYLRRKLPTRRHHVAALEALSAFREQFRLLYGEGETTSKIDDIVIGLVGYYPNSLEPEKSSALTRYSEIRSPGRWNVNLQRYEIKAPVPERKREPSSHSSRGRLLGNLLMNGRGETTYDPRQWTHDGRPVSAILKDRWVEAR